MATVVDALVVTLGLDNTKYKKGAAETKSDLKGISDEAARTGKEMEARGVQAAMFYGKIKDGVIGFSAALAGATGFADFAAKITVSDAAIGRFAHNVGGSVEDLKAWGNAVERNGGSAEAFQGTVKGLTSDIQKWALTGQSNLLPLFRFLDVHFADANGQAREWKDLLLDIADALPAHDPKQAAELARMAGIDDGTLVLLQKGRQAVLDLANAQEKLNKVSHEDTDLAQKRQAAWEDFVHVAESVGRFVLNAFTDPAKRSVGRLYDAANDNKKKQEEAIKNGTASDPRGLRNNNPGNLNFARQAGATLEDGPNARFAKFDTMAEGIRALAVQLQLYKKRGIDTIENIVRTYAPAGDGNNTEAYIADLVKKTGFARNTHLDLSDTGTMSSLIKGISEHENGKAALSTSQIETNIGSITVNTQATDAKGIAQGIGGAINKSSGIAIQANRGMS